jgi:hypothetical protein
MLDFLRNPDSEYWKDRARRAQRNFDKLPLSDKEWKVFSTFAGDYMAAVMKQKNTKGITWHEAELPYRIALEVWDTGESNIENIVEQVRHQLKKLYNIGDWNE